MCVYCSIGAFCPYLENPFESKPTRKGVRKTRIHTLKSGDTCVSSGNSTEDEKDLPRDSIKTASEVSSRDMSSYYFSSHMHPRDGAKPRGRPTFSHRSKSAGDKRGRGTSKPAARPGVRERDQYPDRNSEFDASQQRKSAHHYQRHSSEVPRHSGRYDSPVRNTRLAEDSDERKLSPVRDPGSKKYQQIDENKAAKVISHRRDAPREKQRLTQDLARQKRLLSEDIARAELLQREQLTKKFVDIFDNRKESLDTDRVGVEIEDDKVAKENFLEDEKDCSHSMYERCYGDHSPEYNNDHTNQDNDDIVCKLPVERESLFDRFLRKGTVQEMKSIEFVNESKVEVKGMRYKNNSVTNPSSAEPEQEGVQCCEADSVTNRPEFEPLKFENVSDDELTFSDADIEKPVLENRKLSDDELKVNGGSPTYPKALNLAENGLDSTTEAKCNGIEENCDSIDSGLCSKENLINNLGYVSCECPSEEGNSNRDDKTTESSFMCDSMDCLQPNDPDHSSIKSSRIARLMEEPDMQCEHSSKHSNDCESQGTDDVSSCCAMDEINGVKNTENQNPDSWNHRVCGHEVNGTHSTGPSEKERLDKETKSKQASCSVEISESKTVKENDEVKEVQSSGHPEKGTFQNNSYNAEQNSENVANESELSNIEGMSDAGELSEPEGVAPVSRGKMKKKKRKKPKNNKNVHKPVLNNPRRKSKAGKARSAVKDANASKAVKQLDSESDDDTLQSKSKETCESSQQAAAAAAAEGKGLLKLIDTPNACNELMTSRGSSSHGSVDKDNDTNHHKDIKPAALQESQVEKDDGSIKHGGRRSLSPNEECFDGDNTIEEVVAMGTVGSDNCDSAQELNADSQRSIMEEDGRREQARKEKRIGKTKRKSDEKDRERSTPPHLISQNRYARDLPRHNWLVERLLQQNKLCAEDTVHHKTDANDEQDKELNNQAGKEEELSNSGEKENVLDKENTRTSPVELAEKPEVRGAFSPTQQSDHEDPMSSPRDDFQNELHKSFLRRSFPPNVPKTLPRLKPSSPESSGSIEGGFKSTETKPPPPPLKHALPSKEAPGLEPLPKLRKIVDDKGNTDEPQEKEAFTSENQRGTSSETEQPRKVISPIEILDDDEEKKKRFLEEKVYMNDAPQSGREHSTPKSNDSSQKDGQKSPVKSLSVSSPDRVTPFSSARKPFGTVNPTIPGSMKDKFGRPMHMPPHRAAILIPVVPMHDGNGMPISPGLGPTSPHLKGYSPRTFTPHLLTHSAAVPGPGMFGNPLSQTGRYPATNCGHHMHGNMKSGIPCKRDVNCPFHGNSPRGIHSGIVDIPGHHGPLHAFGPHSHDHLSAVMSRERRECEKSQCRQADCQTYQTDKQSPPGREALGDKPSLQTPKVVKPIAHVPGKRPPLMLSHLQQIGKHSPATLRELEAMHEEKARRFGADLLHSPHQLQKSPERSPREHVVPNMPQLQERRPLHQPLTLSDLNRRREEEMMRVKVDEGLKSKSLPGELILSGLPSPSRGPAKMTTPPHSKDPSLISPGRGHSSATSPVDKRDQTISLRRLVEEREPSSAMSEFLKPGPPRLRPLDEADMRLSSERQRREELSRGHASPFLRMHSAKDAVTHSGKFSDGKEGLGPRGIELLGQAGRLERERNAESLHGNSNIVNPGLRLLDDKVRQSGNRDEQRSREHLSPETEHRLRLEQSGEHKARRRSLELLQVKDKEPRMELREKDGTRIPISERDRPEDILLLRAGDSSSRSRMPFELSPPLRHKVFPDRPFLASAAIPGRIDPRMDPRVDPRMAALHELEMHRRGEAIRASEPSHRELLSRMASSLPISKGGPTIGNAIFVRPDGSLERRGPDSARLPSDVHVYSPPTSLASREYGLIMNSRQAMERLAAAAGKPGSHLAEVGKDVPLHIRQDIERERERERQRLSLEQIEANRRLLHAELKDKVNPLVFSKEHQLRMEQKRDHIDAMRAREKRMADRERLLFMERVAEERKRRLSEIDSHGGILMRHPSPPQFSHVTERDEYDRVKRLKLSEPSVSSSGSVPHSKHLNSSPLSLERKEPRIPSPKNYHVNSSQVRDKLSETTDARVSRPRDNELVRNNSAAIFERDSVWHRNREQAARSHGVIDRKRPGVHPGAALHGFVPPKGGPLVPQRDESKGGAAGKPEDDGVNRCSVCKRDASFLCSGCQAAWYCSSECQLSAWGTHNRECSQNKRQ
ncbi:uncharacterized protein LOC144647353 isoform X2 [Oculina patagonica]